MSGDHLDGPQRRSALPSTLLAAAAFPATAPAVHRCTVTSAAAPAPATAPLTGILWGPQLVPAGQHYLMPGAPFMVAQGGASLPLGSTAGPFSAMLPMPAAAGGVAGPLPSPVCFMPTPGPGLSQPGPAASCSPTVVSTSAAGPAVSVAADAAAPLAAASKSRPGPAETAASKPAPKASAAAAAAAQPPPKAGPEDGAAAAAAHQAVPEFVATTAPPPPPASQHLTQRTEPAGRAEQECSPWGSAPLAAIMARNQAAAAGPVGQCHDLLVAAALEQGPSGTAVGEASAEAAPVAVFVPAATPGPAGCPEQGAFAQEPKEQQHRRRRWQPILSVAPSPPEQQQQRQRWREAEEHGQQENMPMPSSPLAAAVMASVEQERYPQQQSHSMLLAGSSPAEEAQHAELARGPATATAEKLWPRPQVGEPALVGRSPTVAPVAAAAAAGQAAVEPRQAPRGDTTPARQSQRQLQRRQQQQAQHAEQVQQAAAQQSRQRPGSPTGQAAASPPVSLQAVNKANTWEDCGFGWWGRPLLPYIIARRTLPVAGESH